MDSVTAREHPRLADKVYLCMTRSKLLFPIYRLLKWTGVYRLWYPVADFYHSIRLPESARREKTYFQQHRDELRKVYDMLSDENSKRVFKNILMYRSTCKRKYLKNANPTEENQYFVPEIRFSGHEVIVDCGAYIGDTAEKFLKDVPGCRVVSLEPDEENFKQLSRLEGENLKAYQCGAWSEDTALKFQGGEGGSSTFGDSGVLTVAVRALDHIPECQDATYIKMDIEGSELDALKGAEQIIRRNKPKLAICIYHKSQDFFEIPFYIKDLVPNYKFYVHHHHAFLWNETVLYAIPE